MRNEDRGTGVSRATRLMERMRVAACAAALSGSAFAASLSVDLTSADLTQQGTSSVCAYGSASETSAGNWSFTCIASGAKTLTISPALCGTVCDFSLSSLTESVTGNWLVANCVAPASINIKLKLQAPASDVVIPVGQSYRLSAYAYACGGSVTQVQFFDGANPIQGSVVFTAPTTYELDWTPPSAGNHPVMAKALHSAGNTVPSDSHNIYANAGPAITSFMATSPGTVASPPGQRSLPAVFNLSATATDPDGISKVQFLANNALIAPEVTFNPPTTAPATWQGQWTGMGPGTYSVVARAFDRYNASTDSVISLTVKSTNNPPNGFNVTSPSAGSSNSSPVTLGVTSSAQDFDPDGIVTRVDYYSRSGGTSTLVATSTVPPHYNASWSAQPCSPCTIFAQAVDQSSPAGTTQSPDVTFTVSPPLALVVSVAPSKYPITPGTSVTTSVYVVGGDGTLTAGAVTLTDNGFPGGSVTGPGSLFQFTGPTLTLGVHRIVAYSGSPANVYSNEAVFIVEDGTTPAAAAVCTTPASSGVVNGATAGAASVGDMGAASYSIPIQVPPGIAGMAPSLSLGYSSQGGNGLVGAGWALQGLSLIHRCPRNLFLDDHKGGVTYDVANPDALCLDGQRLIKVRDAPSGTLGPTEYRTEHDSYSKVESFLYDTTGTLWNGPAYFKVSTKSGTVMYYGMDLNANPIAFDSVVRTVPSAAKDTGESWAVRRIEDRSGNAIVIKYTRDPNLPAHQQRRPLDIYYTVRPTMATPDLAAGHVHFGYETRSDVLDGYDGGGQRSREDQRLNSITTYADGAAVKTYLLSYRSSNATASSLLQSVQECSGDSQLCLTPTTFAWTDSLASARTFTAGSWTGTTNGQQDSTVAVDVDGDGRTDLVSRNDPFSKWDVCKSTGGGFNCQTWTSGQRAQLNGADDFWQWADFDGDGKADLVYTSPDFSGVTLQRSSGDIAIGNGFAGTYPASVVWNGAHGGYAHTVGDFDGDGRVDLALYNGNSAWKFCSFDGVQFTCSDVTIPGAYQPSGTPNAGFDFLVGDFNGDGRADIAFHTNNSDLWEICYSIPPSSPSVGKFAFDCLQGVEATYGDAYLVHVADMNGDGMADLVAPVSPYIPGQWKVCLSKGDKTFDCSVWSGPSSPAWSTFGNAHDNTIPGDFNGDGRTDLAWYVAGGGWHVCESTGASFNCYPYGGSSGLLPTDGLKNVRAGDFNGDGKTDLAAWSTTLSTLWNVGLAAGSPPDLISKVTNGLLIDTLFTYKPLTDSSVYTRLGDAVYPEIDIQSPMYVVSQVDSTTLSTPALLSTSYLYKGLKGHARGAGLAGFRSRSVTSPGAIANGPTLCKQTTTITNWDARIIGAVDSVTTLRGSSGSLGACVGGNAIDLVANTWESRKSNSFGGSTDAWSAPSQNLSIFEIFLTGSTESKTDLDGSSFPTTQMSMPLLSIDVFGNPKSTSASASDGYGKVTTNSYLNDTGLWVLGNLSQSSVTASVPASQQNVNNNPTRLSSFTYKPVTYLLATETVEPGRAGTSEWMQTSYDYDDFGNRTTTKVNGLGLLPTDSRTSTTTYGPDGRFPTFSQNAAFQTEVRAYDARFGTLASMTGPNGLTTTSTFDKLGRKYCEARPGGSQTATVWSAGGDGGGAAYFSTTTDSTGSMTQQHFDRLNREITVKSTAFDGTLSTVSTTYEFRGPKSSVTKPYASANGVSVNGTSSFSYDDLGRVMSESAPGGYGATYGYHGVNTTVTVTGFSGPQTTQKTINSRGDVIAVLDAKNGQLTLQYDHFGNLEKKTAVVPDVAAPPSTLIHYNTRGQRTALTDPDQGTDPATSIVHDWTYLYDALGEMISQTDSSGVTTTFTYDTLGRMTKKSVNGTDSQWTYDTVNGQSCGLKSAGKLCRSYYSGDGPTRDFTYDALARLSDSRLTTLDGKVFDKYVSYDSMSRVRRLVYPITGYALDYQYNPSTGFLSAITETDGGRIAWQANARYADGQIWTQTVGTTQTTKSYDALGRVATIKTGTLQDASFTFDPLGNLLSRSDGAVLLNETFEYDPLNRLTKATSSQHAQRIYTYDGLGNLTNRSDIGAMTYVAGTHRLATADNKAYTYFANGTVATIGGFSGTRIAYFIPGVPATIFSSGFGGLEYDYWVDADYQRVLELRRNNSQLTGRTYLASDGLTPFFEQEEDVDVTTKAVRFKHYVNTPEGIVAITTIADDINHTRTNQLLLRDHLGSITAVASEDAVPTEFMGFDAWGKRRASSGADSPTTASTRTSRGFTGHEMLDMVGLVHMNGRIYNPVTGRFLQPDPLVQAPANLQSYNRYSYVMNRPLSLSDPTGFSWWTQNGRPIFRSIAAIVAAVISQDYAIGAYADYQASAYALDAYENSVIYSSAYASTTAQVLGSAAGGFAAGGIMGGNIQSALSGAVSAGFTGYLNLPFGDSWSPARVGVNTLASGMTSYLQGRGFASGALSGGIIGLLTYGNYEMRAAMVKDSQLFEGICSRDGQCLSNQSGLSKGLFHDFFKLGGGRLDLATICGEANEHCRTSPDGKLLFDGTFDAMQKSINRSPLGGLQGGAGYLAGIGDYKPGSVWDRLVESFAGPHDFMNAPHYYDSLGNLRVDGNIWNAINIVPAAPFAIAPNIVPEAYGIIRFRNH